MILWWIICWKIETGTLGPTSNGFISVTGKTFHRHIFYIKVNGFNQQFNNKIRFSLLKCAHHLLNTNYSPILLAKKKRRVVFCTITKLYIISILYTYITPTKTEPTCWLDCRPKVVQHLLSQIRISTSIIFLVLRMRTSSIDLSCIPPSLMTNSLWRAKL